MTMEKNGNKGEPAKERQKKDKEAAKGSAPAPKTDYLKDFSDKITPKQAPAGPA